ncbi:ATP-binding protein [Croceicoccus sp. YJ47]|uniref:ATP-binding protein n=1 Tax=Croceicoccus sp. YJ47 TaxID=2798724 RepID=UPI00192156E2|nr:ATP-binding protein [Croceicoccus sp. YJ47]QQN73114.1 HAMP domain-containing protein [Croceicoccus sp. YJ47]
MRGLPSFGLLGRLLAIFLLVLALDSLANAFLFERANNFSLREEDAARMAEHLVIAHRVLERNAPADRPAIARELSTERFRIDWSVSRQRAARSFELDALRDQVVNLEPELAGTNLRLQLPGVAQSGDLAGSMLLDDGTQVSFRTYTRLARSLNIERMVTLLLPIGLLVLLAAVLMRAALRPLRRLVEASTRVGAGEPRPLDESGPAEIRTLINAFNVMQDRVHRSIRRNATTMAAIGHDLRTPLSRLRMRVEDADIPYAARRSMLADVDEMNGLLASLQDYASGTDTRVSRERIDIAAMVETLVDDALDTGRNARYMGPGHLEIMARPVPMRRAISNLLENALHYGGNAMVTIRITAMEYTISVEDDGPGIDTERLAEAMKPFTRLDNARSRDTAGLGLGLAIVSDIVAAEGARLVIRNRHEGGLLAKIVLPRRTHEPKPAR